MTKIEKLTKKLIDSPLRSKQLLGDFLNNMHFTQHDALQNALNEYEADNYIEYADEFDKNEPFITGIGLNIIDIIQRTEFNIALTDGENQFDNTKIGEGLEYTIKLNRTKIHNPETNFFLTQILCKRYYNYDTGFDFALRLLMPKPLFVKATDLYRNQFKTNYLKTCSFAQRFHTEIEFLAMIFNVPTELVATRIMQLTDVDDEIFNTDC